MDIAHRFVKEKDLKFCRIPQAFTIPKNPADGKAMTFLVEEKIIGKEGEAALELSEQLYQQFYSRAYALQKDKWRMIFIQAATLICGIGFWDLNWRNVFILPQTQGLGFIDFESLKDDASSKIIDCEGLIKMAPADFFKDILEVAKEYKVNIEKLEPLGDIRKYNLKYNSNIRIWHQVKKISKASPIMLEALEKKSEGDSVFEAKDSREVEDLQKKLVQLYNKDWQYRQRNEFSLILQRQLNIQPFIERGLFSESIDHQCQERLTPEEKGKWLQIKKELFYSALKELQRKQILCSWNILSKSSCDENVDAYSLNF